MPTATKTIEPTFITAIQADPLTTAAQFYAARLNDNPKAVAFLADEFKLTIEQAAQLQIGFSDRRLGKNLPSKDSRAGRALREQLETVGLYKPTGHETLCGCVTFPLFDENGTITGIYGRRIDRKIKRNAEVTIGTGNRTKLTTQEPTTKETNHTTSRLTPQDLSLTIEDHQITFTVDDRRYRIRGLEKNNALGSLKVNILASRDDLVHLDAIDLVKARSRASFVWNCPQKVDSGPILTGR